MKVYFSHFRYHTDKCVTDNTVGTVNLQNQLTEICKVLFWMCHCLFFFFKNYRKKWNSTSINRKKIQIFFIKKKIRTTFMRKQKKREKKKEKEERKKKKTGRNCAIFLYRKLDIGKWKLCRAVEWKRITQLPLIHWMIWPVDLSSIYRKMIVRISCGYAFKLS